MTSLNTPAHGAATGSNTRPRPRAALPALCLTQITSWGIVYYAFPILNPQITATTGWPGEATTAAFSLALGVSALAGIRIGRILDHRGPRLVMTTGSVLGTVSLLAVATAPSLPVFFAGWALAGLGMASTFYQPAFAALTRWWAPDHVRALTVVTLAGGLASTVFAPLTAPVLGGTFERGEWDTTPSPATAAAILRRCTDLLPELAGAPVLGHRVGLRPFRDSGVRLEADPRPPGRIRRLVHNYGHGGVGVTLAWGCADAATTLVRQPR